jgi:hypothetical protein
LVKTFFKGGAAQIDTCWADHLHALAAHAPKIIWVALGLYMNNLIAMETGESIRLLPEAIDIKAESIPPSFKHLLLCKHYGASHRAGITG